MTLRIRESQTTVIAGEKRLADSLHFVDGLNLICAENNMGKTTALMSILYALGWEGMLSPSRKVPFPPAVTTEIAASSERLLVTESYAMAELEAGANDRLTVRRAIKSESEKTELVRTWKGPVLSQGPGEHKSQDYFVRTGGSAKREAGFHHLLEKFMGWELPEVTNWDGGAVKLYMEVVAPFLFVEQTRGWGWIASVMPRYLRIKDPERRATEFLLSLESLTRASERDALLAQREELRGSWRASVDAFVAQAGEKGVRVENLPRNPTGDWPPPVLPTLFLLHENDWQPIGAVLSALRRELNETAQEIPRVEEVADQVGNELAVAEERASELSGLIGGAARDVREQMAELQSLDERLDALSQDKARYDDAIRLREFGSSEDLSIDRSNCPTCEQALPATLLGVDVGPVMTLEENRTLIAEEVKTFSVMRDDARSVLLASRQRLAALQSDLKDIRRTIRSLKTTLTQSAEAPSQAAIAKQVRLGDRIEEFNEFEIKLAGLGSDLSEQAAGYRRITSELADLGERGGLTASDKQKLTAFGDLVREQLRDFGFTSMPPEEVQLAQDTYLPMRKDVPIRPDELSASDRVRMVWAYLVGLMEISRTFETAHPGLLILDEPGQQEISDDSLRALFKRLAAAGGFGQQVIVATSKPAAAVNKMVENAEVALHQIDGYLLKPQKS